MNGHKVYVLLGFEATTRLQRDGVARGGGMEGIPYKWTIPVAGRLRPKMVLGYKMIWVDSSVYKRDVSHTFHFLWEVHETVTFSARSGR